MNPQAREALGVTAHLHGTAVDVPLALDLTTVLGLRAFSGIGWQHVEGHL